MAERHITLTLYMRDFTFGSEARVCVIGGLWFCLSNLQLRFLVNNICQWLVESCLHLMIART